MKKFPSNVVIADDDEDDISLLESSIKGYNDQCTVTNVRNGLKLLFLLNNAHPEVIFLDINMPVKNGIDCLREMKANPKLADIRVVIYSTYHNKI
jgi:CheY-like chemotaxis protein